jgi:polygalacturonase
MTEHSRRSFLAASGRLAGGALLGGGLAVPVPARAAADPWDAVPEILARIVPPTFPDRTFDITRYGAKGDAKTECTKAFRDAIAACSKAGGGRVLVPKGRFRTGAIHLLSNVDLHVSRDATIEFRTDPKKYLPVVFTRWEGTECYNYSSFVYAYGQTNVSVSGPGTIDGRATSGNWSSWGGGGVDMERLRRQGDDGVPVSQRRYGDGHKLRPNLIQFYRCRNVIVTDVTLRNPAMWTIHPVLCTNVTLRNVTVHSTNSQGDGSDPEACTDVHIVGCRFDSNDDCIALKAGRDADGHRVGVPTSNVVIQRCRFSGRWGGVTIGSEMSGGVRNVFAEDCVINAADFPGRYPVKYALYIKTNRKRGGVIDNVNLRRFTGRNLERDVVWITLNYNNQAGGRIPVVQNLTLRDFRISGARAVLNLDGRAEAHIRNLAVSDSTFTGIRGDDTRSYADNVTFTNVTVNGRPV